jgi:tellurite resistance protein
MTTLTGWIKKTVQQVVDPDRDERVRELVRLLHKGLEKSDEAFSIRDFAKQVDYTDRDIEIAKLDVYQRIVLRAWEDDKVTENEQKTICWVGRCLEIPSSECTRIQHSIARNRFAAALSKAFDDGVVEEAEAKYLEQIARSVRSDLGQFVRVYFRSEGEDFLRGIFAACTEGGVFAEDAWNRLVATTQRLGLSKNDLVATIQTQAERFVEHVLADAKSDGELTEDEENVLLQLIKTFELPATSCGYVRKNITTLRTIRLARHGKLPVLKPVAGVAIQAGEIVHYHAPARWFLKRILKSGESWDEHIGTLTITDNRLVFSSNTKSINVKFGRIVGHAGKTGAIQLHRVDKPESVIRINEEEPIAYSVLEGALALANQTRLAKQEGALSRFIPREVRQRVWQRYGGRCAECGANQYLEFDHIIPVAKGGSNSDANVQLLCRKCNGKKSAFI